MWRDDPGGQSKLAELELDSRFAVRTLGGLWRRLHGLGRDVQADALQSGAQRVVGNLLRDQVLDDGDTEETRTLGVDRR